MTDAIKAEIVGIYHPTIEIEDEFSSKIPTIEIEDDPPHFLNLFLDSVVY